MPDKEYLRSLHRCPICGEVIGCIAVEHEVMCSTEQFREHILMCRMKNQGKTGVLRYGEK